VTGWYPMDGMSPGDGDLPAEIAAVQTPDGEPDAVLIDPGSVDLEDESSEEVRPV
jgi:hypothetical protein